VRGYVLSACVFALGFAAGVHRVPDWYRLSSFVCLKGEMTPDHFTRLDAPGVL